jgi:hypothetical protein
MMTYRVNRKKESGSLFPAPLAGLLTLAALLALSYLWLCGRCEALGRDIQRMESQRAELRRRVIAEEYKWSNLNSLRQIQQALARFDIAMGWPEERRVIRLARPIDVSDLDAAVLPQIVLQPGRGGDSIP